MERIPLKKKQKNFMNKYFYCGVGFTSFNALLPQYEKQNYRGKRIVNKTRYLRLALPPVLPSLPTRGKHFIALPKSSNDSSLGAR